MMTRRSLLAGSLAARPARKTNVVMFMTDDHGAWATGAYGCPEILTPNINRLARDGAKFTRAYACTPVCSPSRMSYMTGKLPSQHGIQDYLLPEDSFGPTTIRFLDGHTTYAEILAARGYRLGMCGKWHMGDDEHAQRGFTYWHTVPGGGGTYRDPGSDSSTPGCVLVQREMESRRSLLASIAISRPSWTTPPNVVAVQASLLNATGFKRNQVSWCLRIHARFDAAKLETG